MKKWKCAVVGCGTWAQQAHLPALQHIPEVEVVALCDVDSDKARDLAESASIPAAFSSVESLLADVHPDIVCIVTPDDAHGDVVEAAASAGVHVVCEKPLATSIDEAERLHQAAMDAGVCTRMGFILRFAPAVQQLHRLLHEGVIGIPHLMMIFQQNGQFLDPSTPAHWKMDTARTGGGAIVEYGIHALDLMLWLMRDVKRVTGSGQTQIDSRTGVDGDIVAIEADDSTVWLAECVSGARVIGHAGWATPGRPPGLELRVYGSTGAARVELSDEHPDDQALFLAGSDGVFKPVALGIQTNPERPWWESWTENLLQDFVSGLVNGVQPGPPSFADGVRAQRLLDAVVKSMGEGTWIEL